VKHQLFQHCSGSSHRNDGLRDYSSKLTIAGVMIGCSRSTERKVSRISNRLLNGPPGRCGRQRRRAIAAFGPHVRPHRSFTKTNRVRARDPLPVPQSGSAYPPRSGPILPALPPRSSLAGCHRHLDGNEKQNAPENNSNKRPYRVIAHPYPRFDALFRKKRKLLKQVALLRPEQLVGI
jgi:hypothetical protein